MTEDNKRRNYELGDDDISFASMDELFDSWQEKGYSGKSIRQAALYLLVNVYQRLPADEIEEAIKCDSEIIANDTQWILDMVKGYIDRHGYDRRGCDVDEDGYCIRPDNAPEKEVK